MSDSSLGGRVEKGHAPIRGGISLLIRRGARTTTGRGPIPFFLPCSYYLHSRDRDVSYARDDPNISMGNRQPAVTERLDSPHDPSPRCEKPHFVNERTEKGDHDPELPVPVFLGLECGYVGAVDGGEGVDDGAGVECCESKVKVEEGEKSEGSGE